MGPCTSSSKTKNTKIPVNKQPSPNVIDHQETQDQQNHVKTATTADRQHHNIEKPDNNNNLQNENFQEDTALHLTLASQQLLNNVQNKKFLGDIRKSTIEGKRHSDIGIQRKSDFIIENSGIDNNTPRSIGSGTLAEKRPKFKKQIAENRVDLKVTLKKQHKSSN